jgi:hypothetical protein
MSNETNDESIKQHQHRLQEYEASHEAYQVDAIRFDLPCFITLA